MTDALDLGKAIKQTERNIYLEITNIVERELNDLHNRTGLEIDGMGVSLTYSQSLAQRRRDYKLYDVNIDVSIPKPFITNTLEEEPYAF
jgi:hypothetical protein